MTPVGCLFCANGQLTAPKNPSIYGCPACKRKPKRAQDEQIQNSIAAGKRDFITDFSASRGEASDSMVMAPLPKREGKWVAFIDKTPGVLVQMMEGDSTDPSLECSRKPYSKVNLISHFASIESIENQLNQGRLQLKK
jgi:hypothetical protein